MATDMVLLDMGTRAELGGDCGMKASMLHVLE